MFLYINVVEFLAKKEVQRPYKSGLGIRWPVWQVQEA